MFHTSSVFTENINFIVDEQFVPLQLYPRLGVIFSHLTNKIVLEAENSRIHRQFGKYFLH